MHSFPLKPWESYPQVGINLGIFEYHGWKIRYCSTFCPAIEAPAGGKVRKTHGCCSKITRLSLIHPCGQTLWKTPLKGVISRVFYPRPRTFPTALPTFPRFKWKLFTELSTGGDKSAVSPTIPTPESRAWASGPPILNARQPPHALIPRFEHLSLKETGLIHAVDKSCV